MITCADGGRRCQRLPQQAQRPDRDDRPPTPQATRHRAWGVVERCALPPYGNTSACHRDLTRFSRSPATLLATVHRLLAPGCGAFGECRAIMHIRHPFDVLVSMYDAWTSTATAEFNKSIAGMSAAERAAQSRRRDELRAGGVDAYVLSRMKQARRGPASRKQSGLPPRPRAGTRIWPSCVCGRVYVRAWPMQLPRLAHQSQPVAPPAPPPRPSPPRSLPRWARHSIPRWSWRALALTCGSPVMRIS